MHAAPPRPPLGSAVPGPPGPPGPPGAMPPQRPGGFAPPPQQPMGPPGAGPAGQSGVPNGYPSRPAFPQQIKPGMPPSTFPQPLNTPQQPRAATPGQYGGPPGQGQYPGPPRMGGPPQQNGLSPRGPPVNGNNPHPPLGTQAKVNGSHGMQPPMMNQPPQTRPGMAPMSQPGMPPMTQPGMSPMPQPGMPPSSQPGMPPSSQPGMPPMSQPGMPPSSQPGMPPMSQPGMPPSSQPGMPPMSQHGMPPSSQPGMPPASQTGMPPLSAPGMPPMSQPGTPMSQPGMPPMSQPGMPPMSQPGMPPRPCMPAMQRPGMPPQPGMPGMPQQGMPPTSQPGMPPRPGMPSHQPGMPPHQPGMPPLQPGMPPQQPGMPPQPGMPGMPPQRPGMPGMPPMPQPGIGGPPRPGQMYPPQPGQQPGMPGMMGAGGPPGGGRRSLDPDQMPSPITVMEDDQRNNGGDFNTNEKGLTPPLVTTKFTVKDYGNASPRYIRSTMYYVPATDDMRKQTGVPFGLVVNPLARTHPDEIEPPVTDFGQEGPIRCCRCKAYMSSLMQFTDGGRKFQCVFCKAVTEVRGDYFQHLDHTGKRIDHYQRPELCLGTYECLATKDYCRDGRQPKPPAVIFAIDVSYPMIKEGVVDLLCKSMKDLLRNLPRDINCDKSTMKVGFMTYDSRINFYNINAKLAQPQQMTVGDVGDMFVPLSEGFFATPEESEAVIDSLMEQIPQMFNDTKETETILGPVIQAGKEAFKAADCTGKLIIFHHNLPIAEAPGKLRNREDRRVLGSDKEKAVLVPQTKDYNQFGQDCVGVGCSVDLFLFNNAYIDIATLSQVTRLTGGQVYKYTYFNKAIDSERLLNDLKNNLSRPVVFDAIMRVRTSTGVRPCDFYGSFYMNNTTDTELASLNSDMSIACEVKYDDKLTEEDGVYIQVALLFTSCSGQRRLRIINLSLNTGTTMADMYRNCELDTIMNFTAKQSIAKIMENNPKTVKEGLIANCAQILSCYRKNCASPSSAGQLILPEGMKLLPLYTNCLMKSDALSGGADVGCDERAFLMNSVSSMDIQSTVAFFYPRLLPLHDLHHADGNTMPDPIRCSIDKIRDDGVYLLENGIYMFMYIGLAADPDFIQKLFGVSSPAQINLDTPSLEELDNPVSLKVRNVIDKIRQERPRQFLRLVVVRQRDKLDILVRHYLCEDRSGPGSTGSNSDMNFSYVDFLCHMHKEIRALLG